MPADLFLLPISVTNSQLFTWRQRWRITFLYCFKNEFWYGGAESFAAAEGGIAWWINPTPHTPTHISPTHTTSDFLLSPLHGTFIPHLFSRWRNQTAAMFVLKNSTYRRKTDNWPVISGCLIISPARIAFWLWCLFSRRTERYETCISLNLDLKKERNCQLLSVKTLKKNLKCLKMCWKPLGPWPLCWPFRRPASCPFLRL